MIRAARRGWLGAVALAIGLASVPAFGEPAMWKVTDEDTTVHLLGTIHMLAPGTQWRSPALDEALATADALWLELDIHGDTSGGMALLIHGTSPKLPLKERLSDEEYADVEAAAARLDVPMANIERLRPWLAAITLAVAGIQSSGFTSSGVDPQLASEAGKRGTAVHGLETAAEQLAIFGRLDSEEEIRFLLETARSLDEVLEMFPALVEAWRSGDRQALEQLMVKSMEDVGPKFAAALLTDRNRAWAERFHEIMAEPGQRVVAVGAGHLVGKDSLPDLLAGKGWTVELVQGMP